MGFWKMWLQTHRKRYLDFQIFSSPFLPLANGRVSTGRAGVLLAERRGSYPLIDLRILKSEPHLS